LGSLKENNALMYELQEGRKVKCHFRCWWQSWT